MFWRRENVRDFIGYIKEHSTGNFYRKVKKLYSINVRWLLLAKSVLRNIRSSIWQIQNQELARSTMWVTNLFLSGIKMRIPSSGQGMEHSVGRHGTASADTFILRCKVEVSCGIEQMMSVWWLPAVMTEPVLSFLKANGWIIKSYRRDQMWNMYE